MAPDNRPPVRASRWKGPTGSAAPPRGGKHRLAFRILGLPVIAVAVVVLYNGLQDYITLPACDSERAKRTLGDVLKQLKFEPLRYEPIKTISSSKEEVVCNAVLPLPDGGSVVADYSFYWQGRKASMKYSISHRAADSPAATPPPSPPTPPSPPLSSPTPSPG